MDPCGYVRVLCTYVLEGVSLTTEAMSSGLTADGNAPSSLHKWVFEDYSDGLLRISVRQQ